MPSVILLAPETKFVKISAEFLIVFVPKVSVERITVLVCETAYCFRGFYVKIVGSLGEKNKQTKRRCEMNATSIHLGFIIRS